MSAWRLLSLLLDYPEEELLSLDPELRAAVAELAPESCREAIVGFLDRRADMSALEAQREYVETFDFAKRSTLYLSFHTYGDRRQRGMAMLHLKQIYRRAGLELETSMLPDHLPVMLEFAHVSPRRGVEVLGDFRPAIELVRASLHEAESPYANLLDALVSLLPPATPETLATVQRIAAEGPPHEEVGLDSPKGFALCE